MGRRDEGGDGGDLDSGQDDEPVHCDSGSGTLRSFPTFCLISLTDA